MTNKNDVDFLLKNAFLAHRDFFKNCPPHHETIFRQIVKTEIDSVVNRCPIIGSENYESLIDKICTTLISNVGGPEDFESVKFKDYCDIVYQKVIDPLKASIYEKKRLEDLKFLEGVDYGFEEEKTTDLDK